MTYADFAANDLRQKIGIEFLAKHLFADIQPVLSPY